MELRHHAPQVMGAEVTEEIPEQPEDIGPLLGGEQGTVRSLGH